MNSEDAEVSLNIQGFKLGRDKVHFSQNGQKVLYISNGDIVVAYLPKLNEETEKKSKALLRIIDSMDGDIVAGVSRTSGNDFIIMTANPEGSELTV
jgi:hypothetical protein